MQNEPNAQRNKMKQTEIQHNQEPNLSQRITLWKKKRKFLFLFARAPMPYNFARFVSNFFFHFFRHWLCFCLRFFRLRYAVHLVRFAFYTTQNFFFFFRSMLKYMRAQCTFSLWQAFSLLSLLFCSHFYFHCRLCAIGEQKLQHLSWCMHVCSHKCVLCFNQRWKC